MNVALVLSGGTGTRMGLTVPKQYQTIAGKPVIVHTLERFERFQAAAGVIVVASAEWTAQVWEWKETYGLSKLWDIAPAGADRQRSILSGLLAAKRFVKEEAGGVIVQDAARPLTSQDLLQRLIAGLEEAPAVMPVLPITDTAYTSQDGQWVSGLLDRRTLFAGQAPEAFHFQPYLRLYQETPAEILSAMSGSCQLPYSRGWKVKMVRGDPENIKITYPADLKVCERRLLEREGPV